ncbi:MAG: glycosyltransferase [archaeon]
MPEFDAVFEVSSEAGRKVGGIYTVLRTKAKAAMGKFGADNYFLFGRYEPSTAKEEFSEEKPSAEIAAVFSALEREGIKCRIGKWTCGSSARLILIDSWGFGQRETAVSYGIGKDSKLNQIKYDLWKTWGIDSLFMGGDFNENVIWSTAVGIAIERLLEAPQFKGKRIVCQFHEWISGAGLLYLKQKKCPVATVFTTHATVLGRSKTTFGENLSRTVEAGLAQGNVASSEEAYRFKLEGKHFMEVACAKNADAFTTVSETVGREVEYILGKKPDVITLNGIEFSKGTNGKREPKREEIENLVHGMFLPQEILKTESALFVYLTARYEFENKGIDYFIDAAGILNKKNLPRQLYFFVFVPSNVSGPNKQILQNVSIIDRMREAFEEISGKNEPLSKILALAKGDGKYSEVSKLWKNLLAFQSPPIAAFDLNYPTDAVISRCALAGLANSPGSNVKIIFYPTYIKPGDGILNLEYDGVMLGCDVGVFPSRYEPFGYTPVEAALAGNIAVTTDYSGFGKFISGNFGETSGRGVCVVRTSGRTDPEIAAEVAGIIERIADSSDEQVAEMKKDALEMIKSLDWEIQIENYITAYALAGKKAFI